MYGFSFNHNEINIIMKWCQEQEYNRYHNGGTPRLQNTIELVNEGKKKKTIINSIKLFRRDAGEKVPAFAIMNGWSSLEG